MNKFFVDPDINKADTLPSSFYKNDEQFEEVKEKVFANSWQFVGHNSILPINVNIYPFEFMQGFIKEPLLIVKNQDESLKCLSNVCTHRANIIIHNT
ncbi:MAG: Rieske 2Fe-2S domain-containing protein, partial [Bacteroidota bacterium]|nr:Rieske 2Fe-2S domain-containing protein [Bacteroidota bacterium]